MSADHAERLVGRADRLDGAGQQRQAGLAHQLARGGLVAHLLHHVGARPDEGDALVGADLGEVGVLGEEAVAGMDRLGAGLQRRADDARDLEVALRGRGGADVDGLVGEAHHRRVGVGGRVDRDRLDAELATRPGHAQRDLAAVGDQDLAEHPARTSRGRRVISRASSGRAGCPCRRSPTARARAGRRRPGRDRPRARGPATAGARGGRRRAGPARRPTAGSSAAT